MLGGREENRLYERHSVRFYGTRSLAMMLSVVVLSLAWVSYTQAQTLHVVRSDRGGYLHDRLIELENLRRNGVQVQIRGRVCYSTCTMFLGLPDTCVMPDTTFGFHGPSRSGRKLDQEDFDYFSAVMAEYYPEPLKSWFMETGRTRIRGLFKIKGHELIRMGVPACQTA